MALPWGQHHKHCLGYYIIIIILLPRARRSTTRLRYSTAAASRCKCSFFIPLTLLCLRILCCTEALCFSFVRRGFRLVQNIFFRFVRILNEFRWNSREVVITTNRLNDYILGEIGTGTRSRIREKNRIDVNRFCYDVKQVLTPSEWIHKFHCIDDGRCDRGHNFTLI